jgi:hypothetical protein
MSDVRPFCEDMADVRLRLPFCEDMANVWCQAEAAILWGHGKCLSLSFCEDMANVWCQAEAAILWGRGKCLMSGWGCHFVRTWQFSDVRLSLPFCEDMANVWCQAEPVILWGCAWSGHLAVLIGWCLMSGCYYYWACGGKRRCASQWRRALAPRTHPPLQA